MQPLLHLGLLERLNVIAHCSAVLTNRRSAAYNPGSRFRNIATVCNVRRCHVYVYRRRGLIDCTDRD